MLIPVSTISRWPAASARRTSASTASGRERALGAAGAGDDAVGAEEAAAVLDLDVGAGPVDPGPAVDDPLDLHAGERRQRRLERGRAGRRRAAVAGCPRRPSSRSTSASRPSFSSFATSRAAGSTAANEAAPTWTAQPVTMTVAAGLARRARRTALRDLSSATAVTVQVLTRWRSAATASAAISTPRARRSRSTASISAWFTLQPRFVMAARRMGGRAGRRVVIGSPEGRLRRHEEGDQAHGGRDRVGDVALAPGALLARPRVRRRWRSRRGPASRRRAGRWTANATTAVTAYVARLTSSQGCSRMRGPSTVEHRDPRHGQPGADDRRPARLEPPERAHNAARLGRREPGLDRPVAQGERQQQARARRGRSRAPRGPRGSVGRAGQGSASRRGRWGAQSRRARRAERRHPVALGIGARHPGIARGPGPRPRRRPAPPSRGRRRSPRPAAPAGPQLGRQVGRQRDEDRGDEVGERRGRRARRRWAASPAVPGGGGRRGCAARSRASPRRRSGRCRRRRAHAAPSSPAAIARMPEPQPTSRNRRGRGDWRALLRPRARPVRRRAAEEPLVGPALDPRQAEPRRGVEPRPEGHPGIHRDHHVAGLAAVAPPGGPDHDPPPDPQDREVALPGLGPVRLVDDLRPQLADLAQPEGLEVAERPSTSAAARRAAAASRAGR